MMDTTIGMVIVFAMFFGTIILRIILSHRSEMERLRTGYYNDDSESYPPLTKIIGSDE